MAFANIQLIENEQLVSRSHRMGALFLGKLKEALQDVGWAGDVRGKGLLVGVELIQDSSNAAPVADSFMRSVAKYLLNRGIIAGKATDVEANHNNILMFAPPLVITESQVSQLVNAVTDAIIDVGTGGA